MTTHSLPTRVPRPALALAAGVLGLVNATISALLALFMLALGGLTADDGNGGWWIAGLVVAAVTQAWGAVRLLRRRGWLLLAAGSLPGLLPLGALFVIWLEYHQDPSLLEAVASLPLGTLVLTLLPRVRAWAGTHADGPPAARGAGTTSGA